MSTITSSPAESLRPPPAPPLGASDDLSAALDQADPLAAHLLYERYSRGIRFFLQRATPHPVPDEFVHRVLLEASRELRASHPCSPGSIAPTILACTHRISRELKSLPCFTPGDRATLQQRSAVVNGLFARFTPRHREILLRAYLLAQPNHLIAYHTGLSQRTIRAVRRRATLLYRQLSAALEFRGIPH